MSELDDIEAKTKAERIAKQGIVLDRIFGRDPTTTKGRFADPAAMFK